MTLHARHLPFSLDPLMEEAKRRMRKRRFLIAAIVLLIAAIAAGAALALRSPSPPPTGSTVASVRAVRLSFRYPAAWTRAECSRGFSFGASLMILTKNGSGPDCTSLDWPPDQHLGADGIVVYWETSSGPGMGGVPNPNGKVGGQPARIDVRWAVPQPNPSGAQCASGRQQWLSARIQRPSLPRGNLLVMSASYCGPDYRAGEAALRHMLASLRFRG
jgi:hypothetical protein